MALDELSRSVALVVAFAIGCAGAPAAVDAPIPAHPLAGCPSGFTDAQAFEGGRYGARGGQGDDVAPEDVLLTCSYPEGQCGYVRVGRVGGCSECWSSHIEWRCHSDTVPRPDGCTYSIPAEGSACDAERTCAYRDRTRELTATCSGGVWSHAHVDLPDPV